MIPISKARVQPHSFAISYVTRYTVTWHQLSIVHRNIYDSWILRLVSFHLHLPVQSIYVQIYPKQINRLTIMISTAKFPDALEMLTKVSIQNAERT